MKREKRKKQWKRKRKKMRSHKPHLLISPAPELTSKRISERSSVGLSASQHTTRLSSGTRATRTPCDSLTLIGEWESAATLHPSTHSTKRSERCCSSLYQRSLHPQSRSHTPRHRPLLRSTNSCCETCESHSESSRTPQEHLRKKKQRKSSTPSHKQIRNCIAPPPMSTQIPPTRACER